MPTANIEQLGNHLESVADFLRKMTLMIDSVLETAREVDRCRASIETANRPLEFGEFVSHISAADPEIGKHLACARMTRFEMGRLYIKCEDPVSKMYLAMRSATVKEELANLYGIRFSFRAR